MLEWSTAHTSWYLQIQSIYLSDMSDQVLTDGHSCTRISTIVTSFNLHDSPSDVAVNSQQHMQGEKRQVKGIKTVCAQNETIIAEYIVLATCTVKA